VRVYDTLLEMKCPDSVAKFSVAKYTTINYVFAMFYLTGYFKGSTRVILQVRAFHLGTKSRYMNIPTGDSPEISHLNPAIFARVPLS
jgi:hypothetical protein